MKHNGKKTSKKKLQKEAVHHRSKYVDQSLKFLDWVNQLGIEKTVLGRIAYALEYQFRLRRLALLFLFSVILAFSLRFEFDFSFQRYQEGDVASIEVRSPMAFEMLDEQATASKKVEAEDSVPPVFDWNREAYDSRVSLVYEAFQMMRKRLPKRWSRNETKREEQIKVFLRHKSDFEEALGRVKISKRTFEWLASKRFSVRIENVLIRQLDKFSTEKVIADKEPLLRSGQEHVIVRTVSKVSTREEGSESIEGIVDVPGLLKKYPIPKRNFVPSDIRIMRTLLAKLAIPNLTLNQQETTLRREKARDSVIPVNISIDKGSVLVSEGAVVQSTDVAIMDEIRRRQASHRKDLVGLFVAGLFVVLILVFFSYIRRFTFNKVRVDTKDFVVMGVVAILMVALSKFIYYVLLEAVHKKFGIIVPEEAFLYMIPAAAGPMLVGLLITSGEIVWLFTTFLSAVLSIMAGFSFEFLLFSIAGGIAGARGVHACKKRQDIYMAGLRVGGVNVVVVGLLTLASTFQMQAPQVLEVLWYVLAAFLSGVLSASIAMMLVPLLESGFNYTTDVRLMELSNLNHPLLKEMIVKAPGTYHHSLVVGNMVEAAAEAIGANPLLAKVSSYYHDIGKMEHSQYFIENQKQGNNPHDHLSPHMSKTILVAHVKDGVELGLKHKLGKPIIDVILQHHGTTLISFFFNRAKEEEDVDIDEIEEDEFRYPGPKPQFHESALCMLADSIEAAARSLDEPNPMRLRNIVKNIIHRKFMDGQLDDCELTLKDLSLIESSFYQILLGIYHQRIDYPKNAGGGAGDAPESSQKGGLKSV